MKVTFQNNAKQLVAVLKMVATFCKRVNIVFTEDWIKIERLSDNHTGYVHVHIDNSDFSMEGFPERQDPIKFGIELKHLVFATKNVTTLSDVICLEINGVEMCVVTKTKKEETSIMLKSEEIDDLLLTIPKDKRPQVIVDTSGKELDEKIKSVRKADGDRIVFKLESDSVVICMEGSPDTKQTMAATVRGIYNSQVFCLSHLDNYVKPAISKKVRLELFDQFPMRVNYSLMSIASYATFHLACCIE